jgi:methylated-DNA-[protein]-cysteine S-methyltransferase
LTELYQALYNLLMFYSSTCPSPVGELTMASDGQNLIGLWIAGQKYFWGALQEKPLKNDSLDVFKVVKIWLEEYFAGKNPDPSGLPLSPLSGIARKGSSEFRLGVWSILRTIPYGKVTTYGAIAKKMAAKMGKPSMSAQAVGGAVGHNPISIIIPCHRVLGAGGSLTGYAAGIATKARLLRLEGVSISPYLSS